MKRLQVFADRHHNDLAYSLQLLFENRLGGDIYFPIGMSWQESGYWLIHKPYNYNIETAKQYLQIKPEYIPRDGTLPLNKVVTEAIKHDLCGKSPIDVYFVEDKHNNTFHKAITLKQFKEMDIDIIIASIPDHWKSFTDLRNTYKPNAKVICQMGNHFNQISDMISDGTVRNLMASTSPFYVPQSVNAVLMHQEFSTEIFKPSSDSIKRQITSFINCYPMNGGSVDYYALKSIMPDYEFKSYGASTDDGVINTTEEMARIMQQSAWGFHVKFGGDGYGHVLYNWFACGKPVITRISDYKGKMGEELLTHMETCIDLDQVSLEEAKHIIENMAPHAYQYMCNTVSIRFRDCVNFEKEQKNIANFLANLN